MTQTEVRPIFRALIVSGEYGCVSDPSRLED